MHSPLPNVSISIGPCVRLRHRGGFEDSLAQATLVRCRRGFQQFARKWSLQPSKARGVRGCSITPVLTQGSEKLRITHIMCIGLQLTSSDVQLWCKWSLDVRTFGVFGEGSKYNCRTRPGLGEVQVWIELWVPFERATTRCGFVQ